MSRANNTKMIGLLLFSIFLPNIVFANAGTPLIWFSLIHLILINAIIGYVESAILSRFKFNNKTWVILLANYVSMIMGFYVIIPYILKVQYGSDLWNGSSGEVLFGLSISFFATLLIEYPFFVASLKNKDQWHILFKPFLIANVVTNIAMVSVYYLIMKS